MELQLIDYGYISACLFGIIVFIYCAMKILEIIKLLPSGSKTRTYWYYAILLIALFGLGYLFSISATLTENRAVLDLILPIIFLFGAVFVFIMVTVSLRTYKAILESAE